MEHAVKAHKDIENLVSDLYRYTYIVSIKTKCIVTKSTFEKYLAVSLQRHKNILKFSRLQWYWIQIISFV
jgi:hypothetical protein